MLIHFREGCPLLYAGVEPQTVSAWTSREMENSKPAAWQDLMLRQFLQGQSYTSAPNSWASSPSGANVWANGGIPCATSRRAAWSGWYLLPYKHERQVLHHLALKRETNQKPTGIPGSPAAVCALPLQLEHRSQHNGWFAWGAHTGKKQKNTQFQRRSPSSTDREHIQGTGPLPVLFPGAMV